jgi:hypothetical protein
MSTTIPNSKYEINITGCDNGFIVIINKYSDNPMVRYEPIIGKVADLMNKGEEWKEISEEIEEEDPKVKSGLYMFKESDELMKFLADILL